MGDSNKQSRRYFFNKINLKDKYRLEVNNDTTYEQVFHFRLRGQGVIITIAISIVVLITLTTVLIAFTPIRELIPGYPNRETRRIIQRNLLKADSLENVVAEWAYYIDNSIRVISGDNTLIVQTPPDSSHSNKPFLDVKSDKDSIFRSQIEQEEQFNFRQGSSGQRGKDLSDIHFITPLKGNITAQFDAKSNHLGIDLVSYPNDIVVAVQDGTIMMSEWTVETGNVITIQHNNDLVSVYKHNAKLLKKQGSRVKAGEAIAIVGNSGELTSGPHLHFELWYRGTPLNPEQYIVF